jgi:hypothetical protein
VDGCETWPATLIEYSISFSENGVLRKVLGSEREIVTENRRHFLKKFNDFCSLPKITSVTD